MDLRNPSESQQRERPSILRACDGCRKKKIRCEPTAQGCAQCTKCGTSCHFTPIVTKRKPRRRAGFKYIAQLEKRLLEKEALLGEKSSGKPTTCDGHLREGQTTSTVSRSAVALITSSSERNRRSSMTELQDPSIELAADLWSHRPLDLQRFPLPAQQQLPTKSVALGLIQETFISYNRFLPLFDEDEFMEEFQLKYSTSNPGDACWWACLNVVLAIAHRLRSLHRLNPRLENTRASGYLQNALSVVSELSVSNHRSLSAVQALVGMACILQGTPDPEPASMLTAAALRLAQAMNLHRECPSAVVDEPGAEKRRRVFWKVYVIDKDISLRTIRPFGQDDEEMDVRLPSHTSFNSCNTELFNHRIGLAIIQGQVYKRLYSIQAGRQGDTQRPMAAQELSSLLSYWKSNAQLESPEDPRMLPYGSISGEGIHKMVLRLTYVHCLTMIDRHLAPRAPSPSRYLVSRPHILLPIGSLCLAESRRAIRLVEDIPQEDSACVWMLLHAFFAAASNILSNLTQDPASPNALSDLYLVRPFLQLLETLVGDPVVCSQSNELRRMHIACNNLNNEVKKAAELSV